MSASSTEKESNVASDAGAKDLLSALVAFLQPVIQGYTALPAPAKASHSYSHTNVEVINGLEGKNLLAALTAFVAAAVHSPPDAESKQNNSPEFDMAVDNQAMSEIVVGIDLPKEVARSELETKTLIAARAHVFNKMPIRLLAFDITGSSIQLIERNKIFDRILPGVFSRIAEPDFELAWAEAETLRDSEFIALSSKYRSNRIKELLKSAVDQSVHYAILSHTWMRDTPGDVTFQDWAERERNPQGNTKITNFCKVAAQNHNVTLGWIDSVCINKESSSELDESIRSMYNWYRGASVCVTFLSDTYHISDAHRDSWFTRGWTLQELLAPVRSVFYNRSWESLGSSSDADIQSVIAKACGITRKELDLSWSGAVREIPFSRRLQMACGRQVTREEDTSYSLMGLLEVDILIAYGEGAGRAFSRLIRELFNTKKNVLDLFNRNYEHGENLLPSSLESYQHRIFYYHDHNGGTLLDDYLPLTPIISTPLGMRISVLLVPGITTDTEDEEKYAPKGVFSAKVPVTFFDETDAKFNVCVHLFDSRLYARAGLASLCAACSAKLPSRMDVISMMGIINFGADNDGHILLPERCFALRLTWNGLQQGNFFPVGKAAILPGVPATFMLNSKKELKVAKADLEKHGMQLVSWYL